MRLPGKVFLYTATLGVVLVLLAIFVWVRQTDAIDQTALQTVATPILPTPSPTPTPTPKPTIQPTKTGRSLAIIPFYVQAPFGVWNIITDDACEEASVLMLYYWVHGLKPSLADHDRKQVEMINYQEERGYGVSVSVQDLKTISQNFLNFPLKLVEIDDADDLRALLDAGEPIIFPADGKKLKNPNFRDGGPVYHMLVIKGYDGDTFITHEPGTKRGENYRYSAATLMSAMGNWTGSQVDASDRRVLLIDE